ncbi:TRIC cation channel family protein [Pseudomonas brassicacearum]|uniref:TRIC cation channel family protein n=1 Tax=Pseudomonas brassicacearum TaxID=930166 RepID=UPI0021824CD6|nr:TRIC cation channel family protein [Pseudomonas brassicacearum]
MLEALTPRAEKVVLVADLVGTAVFAIEGAISAMRSNLDLLSKWLRRCALLPTHMQECAGLCRHCSTSIVSWGENQRRNSSLDDSPINCRLY